MIKIGNVDGPDQIHVKQPHYNIDKEDDDEGAGEEDEKLAAEQESRDQHHHQQVQHGSDKNKSHNVHFQNSVARLFRRIMLCIADISFECQYDAKQDEQKMPEPTVLFVGNEAEERIAVRSQYSCCRIHPTNLGIALPERANLYELVLFTYETVGLGVSRPAALISFLSKPHFLFRIIAGLVGIIQKNKGGEAG